MIIFLLGFPQNFTKKKAQCNKYVLFPLYVCILCMPVTVVKKKKAQCNKYVLFPLYVCILCMPVTVVNVMTSNRIVCRLSLDLFHDVRTTVTPSFTQLFESYAPQHRIHSLNKYSINPKFGQYWGI